MVSLGPPSAILNVHKSEGLADRILEVDQENISITTYMKVSSKFSPTNCRLEISPVYIFGTLVKERISTSIFRV